MSVAKKWGLADSAAFECGEEVGTGGQFCSNFRGQFTPGRQTTVPNFRRIGQLFLELQPLRKIDILPIKPGWTSTSRHSLINNFSNN